MQYPLIPIIYNKSPICTQLVREIRAFHLPVQVLIKNYRRDRKGKLFSRIFSSQTLFIFPRKFSMGYIDSLGRFIRDPDVDSLDGISSNRKTSSNPIQFLTNLVRNEQDELVNYSFSFHSSKSCLSGPGRSCCEIRRNIY
jgi:hypothetical protein